MAVSHVQFASAVKDNSYPSIPITVTLGSAPTVGNVLLMFTAVNTWGPQNLEPPTGFTEVGTAQMGYGIYGPGFRVWYRVVESGDGTSYTVTTSGNAHYYSAAAMVEVSGSGIPVVRSIPFDDADENVYFSDQGTVQSTSYTLMMVYATGTLSSGWTATTPTGFTELFDYCVNDQGVWLGYDIGATTIPDWQTSVSTTNHSLVGMAVEFPESGTDIEPWDGVNTVTVKPAGGGDYTTFSAAVADWDIRNGIYRVEYAENTAFSSDTTISLGSTYNSNAAFDRYVHITAAEANRHSGVTGTGHARVDTTYRPFTVQSSDYVRISHLELLGDNVDVYCRSSNHALFDNLILNEHNTTSGYAGFDLDGSTEDFVSIYNCLYMNNTSGYQRMAVYFSQSSGTNVFIAHCCFDGYVRANAYPIKAYVYNSWFTPGPSFDSFEHEGRLQGPVYGSNNAYGALSSNVFVDRGNTTTTGFTNFTVNSYRVTGVSGSSEELTTTTTGNTQIIVTGATRGFQDFTPVAPTGDGYNPILGRGGKVPAYDPRIDLTTDIAGNTRPTTDIDIGAFQITATEPEGLPVKVWTGSTWVNLKSIGSYDGGWT